MSEIPDDYISEIPDDYKILKHEFPDVSDLFHPAFGLCMIPIDGDKKLNVSSPNYNRRSISKYTICIHSYYGIQMPFYVERLDEVIEYAIAMRTEDKFKGG
jgi:hypothetical protein